MQAFITIFQVFLFSGALIQGPADKLSEKVFLVLGIITTISDIIANAIPWALGGQVRAETLFADLGEWIGRAFSSPLDFAAFVVIMALSLIIAVGGEVCMGRVIWASMNPQHQRH